MAIADAFGFPVAAYVGSASPHEVKLVEETIDSGFTEHAPDKLIGDKAYDSDPLDQKLLEERGIELIAPHKKNRKSRALKMDENFVAIGGDGRLNACLLGYKISGAWL